MLRVIQSVVVGLGMVAFVSGCGVFAKNTKVYVNQVGYQTAREKFAVVESASPAPVGWEVLDASGRPTAKGMTEVRGVDSEAGESVHWVRFDVPEGSGYRLRFGEETSEPFDVQPGIYRQLKYDALQYFYHNRSGTPIELPWAKDLRWTRPPGHLSDSEARCVGRRCNYELDVQGGWYDAGDYGKYVVNGGIALWTLLNLYERTKYLGTSLGDFEDGKLSIPEQGNGVSDLLDEARWELEFLLRMQVPDGDAMAGMVHHKIHDNSWSALGHAPPGLSDSRGLHPPSTAATLNLAATAAQGARIFAAIDAAFSERCRRSAIRAWNAAHGFPKVFASAMNKNGGGPYDDNDVSDEFYWAAAELFVTTADPKLKRYLEKHRHFAKATATTEHEHVRHFASMTWQSTATLGTISLAVVPNQIGEEHVETARRGIVSAADEYVARISESGFRVPMRAGNNGHYPWGSNSFVLNNAIILALAGDFTGDGRYLQGVAEAMDYILGRNPLSFSYVSGYGEHALANPHHRFWAHQRCHRCPPPPPGAVAGGPNSRLPDPIGKRMSGNPVLKCYLDHVDAWGENEVAINWNAPLAWVAAYLDEQRGTNPTRRQISLSPPEPPAMPSQ